MMDAQEKNGGFTLLELIIAAAVMAALTGMLSGAAVRLYRSAVEKRYVIEAEHVCEAAGLYLLDRNGEADSMDLVYEITRYRLDEKKNVLLPYLEGNITKGAFIQWMIVDSRTGALLEIEYCAAGYVIDAEWNGKTVILERPGSR